MHAMYVLEPWLNRRAACTCSAGIGRSIDSQAACFAGACPSLLGLEPGVEALKGVPSAVHGPPVC